MKYFSARYSSVDGEYDFFSDDFPGDVVFYILVLQFPNDL